MNSVRYPLLVTCLALALIPGYTQEQSSESLTRFKFLAGAWKGTIQEDLVEEHWSEPAGDALIGMFRWVGKDGKTRLYELLTIRIEAEGPTLRLRHFDGSFTPWASEAAGVPALRLSESTANRAVFTNVATTGLKSCDYAVQGDELTIIVSFHDANRPPLRFQLKRKK